MAHQLSMMNGIAEMAYVGKAPWHGLGHQLQEGASIEEWVTGANMGWTYETSPVLYQNGELRTYKGSKVIYRGDNNAALSIVSEDYKIVQPSEVLEFFRDLTNTMGFTMETAGVLFEGRRLWALAKTNMETDVVPGDRVKGYLLLATSCDLGLATTAMYTSVRVVCNNTLSMSLREQDEAAVKVRHSSVFDPQTVKDRLGLSKPKEVFDGFIARMQSLAHKPMSAAMSKDFLTELLVKRTTDKDNVAQSAAFKSIMGLFNGGGKGSGIEGVRGTAWGMVNAVTEYADFMARARSDNNRLSSAWFGPNANLKDQAVKLLETI